MDLIISTPEKEVINQGSISFINITLSDGYPISVYPGHAPLIALLSEGIIKYQDGKGLNKISISEGLIKIDNDLVKCFVNWAITIEKENLKERSVRI